MFAVPLESQNAARATSLADEHQNRQQLQDFMLHLTSQKQQQDLEQQKLRNDLFSKYAMEMQNVGRDVPQLGPLGDTPPTPQDINERTQLAAAKYAQPGAYQWGNAIERSNANDIRREAVDQTKLRTPSWIKQKLASAENAQKHGAYAEERRMGLAELRKAGLNIRLATAKSVVNESLINLRNIMTAVERAQANGWRDPRQVDAAKRDIGQVRNDAQKIRETIATHPDMDNAEKAILTQAAATMDREADSHQAYLDDNVGPEPVIPDAYTPPDSATNTHTTTTQPRKQDPLGILPP